MIRSTLFNILFYISTAVILVVGSPLLFGPRSWAMAGLKFHALVSIWLLRWVAGIYLEVRGSRNIPQGAALVASKHQSSWETFGLIPLMPDPAMIMKAELMKIPFYGWFSKKFGMIPIERGRAAVALRNMLTASQERLAGNRQVVIFPEGRRRAPGAAPDYRAGVVKLYEGCDVPCVPVALNTGLFWPRRSFRRFPGTIVVEFLKPIQPGLDRSEFRQTLEVAIEGATGRLIAEALVKSPNLPVPETVAQGADLSYPN
ncbi:MAG: lysophospholipid acyltransferase family protein [Hyphomicrobiaceae bacterium]